MILAQWRGLSLFRRVFATYAAVLVLVFLLLVFAPVAVSIPVALTELTVLAAGLVCLLALTLALLRTVFRPLDAITATMRRIDMLAPGQRVPVAGEPDVAALAQAFNEMLQRLERERRDSARVALLAQEAERRRVARELHDEIGQLFAAIVLQIEALAERVPHDCRADLERLREAAREGATGVRGIAARLRPEALEELGLRRALSALAGTLGEHAGIPVARAIEPVAGLGEAGELVVYRVAQEALTNVVRHAGASAAELSLRRDGDAAVLRVRDDGRGLPPAALASPGGIRGMRERAMLIEAQLTVGGAAEGGTEVVLRVPLRRS